MQLAARNHGIPLEALRYDVTPAGLHYLLIHYDIPEVDASTHALTIGGAVDRPLTVTLADLRARPRVTEQVTLECAGNGRALLHPAGQPALAGRGGRQRRVDRHPLLRCCGRRASGRTRWAWSSPAPITAWSAGRAGLPAGASGRRRAAGRGAAGVRDERRSPAAAARRTAAAHRAGLVRHGPREVAPLRRDPDRAVRGVSERGGLPGPPERRRSGVPVTRIEPRALVRPPGFPDFMSRRRVLRPGLCTVDGRAWSGHAPVVAVEVTTDGGQSWAPAELDPAGGGDFAWRRWRYEWTATPGRYVLGAGRPTRPDGPSRSSSRGTVADSPTTWCSGSRSWCRPSDRRRRVSRHGWGPVGWLVDAGAVSRRSRSRRAARCRASPAPRR
ncbi:molybdopterin-dependent oxidoreductase [Micromonospora sp. M12]